MAAVRVGDKVHYQPSHYPESKWENGMVKEIPEYDNHSLRVVFHCAGDWDNFKNYTGQLTSIDHLKPGWKHGEEEDSSRDRA